ncbi:hypothetical protein F5Y04DRAFT_284495 [Hypomontagnella monticulosa]|nr:hypothetical protein F5Y04DRAFT_284495 [Hypomontagnella monticulosa]
MENTERLDRVYTRLMRNHEGRALWHKVDPFDMEPGSVGYFDADGTWKLIVHLLDDNFPCGCWAHLERAVEEPNSDEIVWGPKHSPHVWVSPRTPAARGLETSVNIRLDEGHERGAVLLTEPPITREAVTDDKPLVHWFAQNADKILKNWGKKLNDHGLWIVTKTYATRRCIISLLQSQDSELAIALRVDESGCLTLTRHPEWSRANGQVTQVMYQDEDGVVVFMGGVYITKETLSERLEAEERRKKQKMFRGEGGSGDGEDEQHFTIRATDVDGSEALLSIKRFDSP